MNKVDLFEYIILRTSFLNQNHFGSYVNLLKMRCTRINEIKELQQEVYQIKERLAVAENTIKKIEQKIEKIDNNTSWTVRLIIGAIILAIINYLMKGFFLS